VKHIEQHCGIQRELLAHDHRAWMSKGKAPVRNRNADRLVAQIKTSQGLATAEPCRQFLDRDDAQRLSLDCNAAPAFERAKILDVIDLRRWRSIL